jgi:decaprenylphospho-beta-D-erythro-pentofuranosid-2-ulose 2-reductase
MKIVIIGATSAIAKATARLYAERKEDIFLIGRDQQRLIELAQDLSIRGAASVGQLALDLSQTEQHGAAIAQALEFLSSIDVALICHGSLPNQEHAEVDFEVAQREININGLSVISLLTVLSAKMKEQQHGTLAVITSVAGDRGRQPNFVYGAAKAMVSTYLQGLRGKLLSAGVHVVDIRPGLVDSPMTAHLDKGPLWSTPQQIARKIVTAIDRNSHTVYAPGYWRLIMALVRSVPEFIFKHLKF